MNPPTSPPPKRPRGAQPGNTNAVTHGLYAVKHPQLLLDAPDTANEFGVQLSILARHARRFLDHPVNAENRSAAGDLLVSLVFSAFSVAGVLYRHGAMAECRPLIECFIRALAKPGGGPSPSPDA